MTKKEGAIISAYTGKLIGDFPTFMDYVSELLGRPVTHVEIPDLETEIKRLAEKDFCLLKVK